MSFPLQPRMPTMMIPPLPSPCGPRSREAPHIPPIQESNTMRAILLSACLVASVATAGPAQTIVSSFLVAPAGTAFPGGLEFDCNSNIVWIGDKFNNLILAYDGNGNFLKQYAALPPPGVTL